MEESEKEEVLYFFLPQNSFLKQSQSDSKQIKSESLMITDFYELLPTFQDEINEEKSGFYIYFGVLKFSCQDHQRKQFRSPLGASETTKSGSQQNLKMQTIFEELMQYGEKEEVKQIGQDTQFGSQYVDEIVEEKIQFKRSSQQKLTFPFQSKEKNGKNGDGTNKNPCQNETEFPLDQVRSLLDFDSMFEVKASRPPGLTSNRITPKKKKNLNIKAQQFFSTKQEQKQDDFSFLNMDYSEKIQKPSQQQQNELELISYSCDEFNKIYQFQQQESQQKQLFNQYSNQLFQPLGVQNSMTGSQNSFSQSQLMAIPQQQLQQHTQQGLYQQQQQQQQQYQSFKFQQPRYCSTAELEQMSYQFSNQQQQQLQPQQQVPFKQQQQQQQFAPGQSIQNNDRKPIILETTPQKFTGVLKYFDTTRYYGFIVSEQQNQEIFFHLQDITHPLLTKEYLSTFKDGNIIKLSFTICTYIGKYNISKKAINIEPLF